MRGYLALVRGTLTIGLVYRFGFLFTIIGNVLYMFVAYFLWRSIYGSNTTLNGMTFHEAFLYIALASTIFILLKTYTDWQISNEIRDGAVVMFLIKPIDYLTYVLATGTGFMLTNLIGIIIPTFIMIVFVFKIPIVWGPGLLFFPFSLFMAFLISYFFDCIIGLTSFYTEAIWGISASKEVLVSVMAGALVPLQFFPEAVQKILYYLPFQTIYHIPLMFATRPDQDWPTLLGMFGTQIFWAVILLVATRLFYNQSIKVLRVAGG